MQKILVYATSLYSMGAETSTPVNEPKLYKSELTDPLLYTLPDPVHTDMKEPLQSTALTKDPKKTDQDGASETDRASVSDRASDQDGHPKPIGHPK